jgi:hypothetical protein
MSRAIANSVSNDAAAGIGDANHEASSVRWLVRCARNRKRKTAQSE